MTNHQSLYNDVMENIKQVIVVRKDLSMRKGKLAAQVAHASMKVVLDRMIQSISSPKMVLTYKDTSKTVGSDEIVTTYHYETNEYDPLSLWLNGKFTKIVLGCLDLESLQKLYDKAKELKIPCAMITDAGLTEFKEPTITCIAIGPYHSDNIDEITGELKPL